MLFQASKAPRFTNSLECISFASEPDALQYPLSLLTVACLVEGILAALIQKHNYRVKWRRSILEQKARENSYVKKKRQKTVQRIEESAEGVIHDIQAVIGISDVSNETADEFCLEVISRCVYGNVGYGWGAYMKARSERCERHVFRFSGVCLMRCRPLYTRRE